MTLLSPVPQTAGPEPNGIIGLAPWGGRRLAGWTTPFGSRSSRQPGTRCRRGATEAPSWWCTFYKEVDKRARLCAISLSQAASAPDIRLAGIVHNAVELPAAPPSVAHERYLIEVARIIPDKGQHLAIQVAQRAGRKLILAGKVERSGEGLQYFEEQVEPFLSPTVEYYPNVAGAQKARLISRAAAGIFPLQWAEPLWLAIA